MVFVLIKSQEIWVQDHVETSSGKLVRGLQSTYRRNGTLNLFAALNVVTGEVKSKTTKTKKRPDFQSFLDDVVKDIPEHQEIHVIISVNDGASSK